MSVNVLAEKKVHDCSFIIWIFRCGVVEEGTYYVSVSYNNLLLKDVLFIYTACFSQ